MKKYFEGIVHFAIISIVTILLFWSVFKNLNSSYFATSGDGLQMYFGSYYHVKYDTTYWRTAYMNYPYGESIFFTGVSSFSINAYKFFSNHIFDISDYTIAFVNLLMISSIVFCSLFLFLLFKRFKIPLVFAHLFAIGITLLSPQIARFSGHFSLSYLYIVPLILYLLKLYDEKPKYIYLALIAIVSVYAFTCHPYFMLMAMMISGGYLVFHFRIKEFKKHYVKDLFKIFLTVFLPYLICSFMVYLSDNVIDRTDQPWGFMFYRAFPESVLLPLEMPYGDIFRKLFASTGYITFEAISYIGIAASLFTFFLIYVLVKRMIQKRTIFVFESKYHSVLFLLSFAVLFFSFGFPFILNMEWLVNYLGPIKQMRGIGRFAWVYYYVINIILVYYLFTINNKKIKYMLAFLVALFIMMDAFFNIKLKSVYWNQQFPIAAEIKEKKGNYKWLNDVDLNQYQSVIPLPYYHLGSENIWMQEQGSILQHAFALSMFTGIPSSGIYLSRTSISQSLKNIQFAGEPYRISPLIHDLTNTKPFLVLVMQDVALNNGELKLCSLSKKLFQNDVLSVYSFNPDTILKHNFYADVCNILNENRHFDHDEFISSEFKKNAIYQSFDTLKNDLSYRGTGCFKGDITQYNCLFSGNIPNYNLNSEYEFSFWMNYFDRDKVARTNLIITYLDENDVMYKEDWFIPGKNFSIIDSSWALVSYRFRLRNAKEKIRITLQNDLLSKGVLLVDEFMIRPVGINIFLLNDSNIVMNNRSYSRNKNASCMGGLSNNKLFKLDYKEMIFLCDAERIKDGYLLHTNLKDCFLEGGTFRTNKVFFEGANSLHLTPENPYGFTYIFANTLSIKDIFAKVMILSESDEIYLVVSDPNTGAYFQSSEVIAKNKNGWREINIKTPAGLEFSSGTKIYVWNAGKKEAFVDNIKINSFVLNEEN